MKQYGFAPKDDDETSISIRPIRMQLQNCLMLRLSLFKQLRKAKAIGIGYGKTIYSKSNANEFKIAYICYLHRG